MAVRSRTLPPFLRGHGAQTLSRTPPRRIPVSRPHLIDACLAVAFGLAVLGVHNVPNLLTHPFWVDEAWVADTVRAPIGMTHSLAVITPLGWTYLLRLVPGGGPEQLRLIPLAFTMLATATGYLVGRELRLDRYTTGMLTGAAVLLSPTMLRTGELKSYTAEACACLLLWVLVARAENEWQFRRLAAIAAVGSVGLLFSNTVIFVGLAAMASLGLECLVKRHYRRLAEVAAATAGMLIVSLAIYVTLMRPEVSPRLAAFWEPYYVPTASWHGAITFVYRELKGLAPVTGFRSYIIDAVALLAGIGALIWMRRIAMAAMFPITLAIVIVASAAHKYPFGDFRTSIFWLVVPPVLMAIAVSAVGRLASRLVALISRQAGLVGQLAGRLNRRVPALAPALVAAAALALWVPATNGGVRSNSLPDEDVQSQVSYLDHHFRHGDVIVVSFGASYGFAYYYPPTPSFPAGPGDNNHVVAYPSRPWIIVLAAPYHLINGLDSNVIAGLAEARAKLAAEPATARGRIWIIRSHVEAGELSTWDRVLAGQRFQVIKVGPEPIVLYPYQLPGPGALTHSR